jgi:simple sugar transport system substrate-binding protein
MFTPRRATALAALATMLVALGLTACSSKGGKSGNAATVTTQRFKIAMITHEAPGDTFWTIVRKGAQDAAAKDNVELVYSNDPEAGKQATLVQNAIDSKVNGIALTLAHPDPLKSVVQSAISQKIPVVAFNSGLDQWRSEGAVMYFGQDENLAGEAAGKRLTQEGAKHVVCVIQEQGQVALEARCAGLKKGFTGGTTENLQVNGTDMPSVRSTISAKLQQDKSIDRVMGLGAPIAMTAVQAVKDTGSPAKVVTFDTNKDLVSAIKNGDVQWAVDQQPYLQGYEAIDSLWLYLTNGNLIGGGQTVLTGPSFITKDNIDAVSKYADKGTR